MPRLLHTVLAAAAFAGLGALAATAGGPDHAEMSEADMMAAWQAHAKTGEKHELLNSLVGEWDVESTLWMAPGAPPISSKGSASAEWILDGKFIQENYRGDMMGTPFTGMSLMGYDNFKKKYVGIWIDSMNSSLSTQEFLHNPQENMLIGFGHMDEFMTGEHDKTVKYTIQIHSEQRHTFELHDPYLPEGKTRIMRLEYTRR